MNSLLSILVLTGCLTFTSGTTCRMTDTVCEFWLDVDQRLTMMTHNRAVYPLDGKLYDYEVTNVTGATPVDVETVVSADGWETPRVVITVNKTMPGPAIEVYEGQTLIVHVTNHMTSIATSIHWHGLHQAGTPWMDGVAFLTQCPILPGQQFTYKFQAYPKGTFWYHAHTGTQLSMGLLGPLIIRERKPLPMKEYILVLQDWNHDFDADTVFLKMMYGNYVNRKKVPASRSLEGAYFSMFPFQSGLINGRGRYHDEDKNKSKIGPLTVYTVNKSESYRFRVIGSGNLYPFRVSIDDHNITLVASDGFEFEPVTVESFIINPGERYDFILTADQKVANYWIRAVTLEINAYHIAEAILRYEGAADEDPKTVRKHCTRDDGCVVVNCPFSYYPDGDYVTCVHVDHLRSPRDSQTPGANTSESIEDIFLNFAFPGITETPGSTNGRHFKFPTGAAITQPDTIYPCDTADCGEDKNCKCTYSIDLKHNQVYQLVFLNMGRGKGWAHPIHMHGHSFHVLKMGYPKYDNISGRYLEDNLDIDCGGNKDRSLSFCNAGRWANSSWGGNNVPGLELSRPVVKDTIMVPTGGYVVVRIRADNPGLWFMHCHIELHSMDGMAVAMNESFAQVPPPPADFPTCGSFLYTNKSRDRADNRGADTRGTGTEDDYDKNLFWIVVGCLLGLVGLQFVVILVFLIRWMSQTSSVVKDEYYKKLIWIVVGCLMGLVVLQFIVILIFLVIGMWQRFDIKDEYDKSLFWTVVGCLSGLSLLQFFIITMFFIRWMCQTSNKQSYTTTVSFPNKGFDIN